MKKNNQLNVIFGVLGIFVVGAMGFWFYDKSKPGDLDQFALCLQEKEVKFYGAFWCPHCQKQKALFGKSKTKLPYVECSNADQKTQTQICIDKKIVSYPTWEFRAASGTELISGEKTLKELADKSGCKLPDGVK